MNTLLQRTMPNEQIRSFLKDKQAWESAIAVYTGPDPLAHWYNFVCWYDCNIHGDPENKFRETLEKCLTLFEHNEYYKQDVRMVKLWVKYIDLQPNPLNLYQILYQRGIGKQCACFYIGWAHYYDSANAFKEAESVYNLGFQAKAEPYTELHQAHTKFRFSLSQRMLYNDNSSKKQSANHLNEQRQQITTLAAQEQSIQKDDVVAVASNDGGAAAATTTTTTNGTVRQHIQTEYQAQPVPQTHTHPQPQTSSYTDLQNSATVISSSLNYIYNEAQAVVIDEDPVPIEAGPLENVKLPQHFANYCRNNYEVWKPALFLEEPFDPNRRCLYQKELVYPGDGEEYSPEEIRGRLWSSHLKELRENRQRQEQDELMRQQLEQEALQRANQARQIQQQQLQHQQLQLQQQQLQQQQQQQQPIVLDDIEDQIEASTIHFSTNTDQGTPKTKTLKIKFKKEKPLDNNNGQNGLHYSIDRTETPTKSSTQQTYSYQFEQQQQQQQQQSQPQSNGFHPYNCQTSTPKAKKMKKLKIVNNYTDPKYLHAKNSNSNSSDYIQLQQQNTAAKQPQNHFDDANLLLSFAKTPGKGNYREAVKLNDTHNGTFNYSLNYNDNANFSFNESNYENSNCSMASAVGRLNFRDTQRDDFSTYAENSFFATENDKELKQKRLDKALKVIETHLAKETIDPFSSELCKAFLTKLDFPSYETKDNMYKVVNTPLPKMANTKTVHLADIRYNIEKEVGRGSYGSVYKAIDANTGLTVALKYQKPPNIWELYVCNEVRQRIKVSSVLPGLMDISSAVIAPNASILATEFSPYGSLLDINNKLRQATKKVMHESLVMHFSSQILSIIHYLHASQIIHADIKPDNFLLMRVPNTDLHYPSLRLIDFGCAIDMTQFPEGTQFRKVIQTDGFTCVEMQEGKTWSYQTDLFCVAGTVHVMLFGEYMQIQKKFENWDIKQKLPRYLKKHVWTEFFPKLLNIKDVENLPNLMDMKMQFDEETMKMDSELQNQIRTLSNLLHRR